MFNDHKTEVVWIKNGLCFVSPFVEQSNGVPVSENRQRAVGRRPRVNDSSAGPGCTVILARENAHVVSQCGGERDNRT